MTAKILKHPITIFLSIIIGSLFGIFFKNQAIMLAPIGEIYLNFFQMSVIPILITAIVSSLAQLMKDKNAQQYVVKMIVVFLTVIFIVSFFGTIVGVTGRPGKGLNESTMNMLGKIIKTSEKTETLEMSLKDSSMDKTTKRPSIWDFFKNIVPANIFSSLGLGRALEIVFFSIIFGVVLGFVKDQSSQLIIDFSKSLLEAFQKLINWTMYGLPIGLIFLIGNQIAQVGAEIFLSMIKFIILFYVAGILLFIICTIVIWIRSGIKNPITVLKAMLEPIIVSLATRNSFAALPSTITSLETNLKFNPTTVNLVMPLGMTILRFGNILYFAIASCFVAQIYGAPIDFQSVLIIIIGSVFAGTATSGSSGLLTLPMISIILNPLGLPIEAILIIFMAIDSIIDPMRTFLIVYCNMATTTLIAKKDK